MTIHILRGKTESLRRSWRALPRPSLSALTQTKPPRTPSYGIGDADAHVFNCPVCARPLPDGTWKCPGCGTRLVFGVTLKRAGGLLSFGLVVGILLGGLAMSVAIGLGLPSTTEAATGIPGNINPGGGPAASLAPGETPIAAVAPKASLAAMRQIALLDQRIAEAAVAPKASLAAMRQIALLDQRIAEDGASLASAVRANRPDNIARALRALGADAAVGAKYVGALASWADAAALAESRGAFYDKVGSTSRAALVKSVSNKKAYKASGKSMLTVLKKVPKLDTEARTLAATVGSELPIVDYSAID